MPGGEDVTGLSREEAASLLAWWVEAGVDVVVSDEPRDWRAKAAQLAHAHESAERVEPPSAPLSVPRDDGPDPRRDPAPDTLEEYHSWLAQTADLPLFRSGAARALPHGPANAEVMLLAGIPALEDVAEGRPIGGPAWVLTLRMLAAIGLTGEQAYVAALTCFSGTGSRLSPQDQQACRESLLAQMRLAAPKRLLLLGDAPARLLLDLPLAQARGKVHRIAGVPTVVTFHPRHLLGRSADKALAWRDLLLLMGEPL